MQILVTRMTIGKRKKKATSGKRPGDVLRCLCAPAAALRGATSCLQPAVQTAALRKEYALPVIGGKGKDFQDLGPPPMTENILQLKKCSVGAKGADDLWLFVRRPAATGGVSRSGPTP